MPRISNRNDKGIWDLVPGLGSEYLYPMSVAGKRFQSGEEYLEWEKDAFEKSEFIAGEIYAMAGAGLAHNTITSNLNGEIRNGMKGRPCQVFSSDMKVRVDVADAYFYPDISGLCGEFEFHDGRNDIFRNPGFIIEVISDSTESYDRGMKFLHYQTLPSLKEYVLVSQRRKLVETYRKDEGCWIYHRLEGEDAVLKLESVKCEIPLSEIFSNIMLSKPEFVGPDASVAR